MKMHLEADRAMRTTELVILNYNGRRHLEELLPTALAEANAYPGDCRVVVIDNRSTDSDADWINRQFPEVGVWIAPENEFLFSYNTYAARSKAAILVFLNNDLKLLQGFVQPLVQPFAEDDVFAVSATSRDWQSREFTFGPTRLSCHHGDYFWLPEYGRQEYSHTLFTSGGFMAVDRLKFLELGGFDRLYHPAYCEDLDLCFRAWRNGWRCLFQPLSVVLHREHGSWKNKSGNPTQRLMLRNKFLFVWSSLPKGAGTLERATYIIIKAFRKFSKGIRWELSTFLHALRDWRVVCKKNKYFQASHFELNAINVKINSPPQLPVKSQPMS